ncbi:hypothetical protein ACOSQ2_019240 [Xanthoceras sorbifolium]
MSIIGEALLSATIEVLFEKLASSDLLQFARQEQIHADLEKWKKTLVKIEAVLDDAEEKQTTDRLVETWLGELKNLAYDVEDMLDEFATEALQRKSLDEPQASTSKVRKFIPTCCTGFNPQSFKLNSAMASQIEEITTRLQKIVEERNNFDLKENSGLRSNRAKYQRLPATSLNEPHIYGRENDKKAVLDLLLTDNNVDTKFSVISIEGMGGLGKTTLAQLVYNDVSVKDHFEITAWTCVSDDFNVTQVTKTILQSMASDSTVAVDDLNMLQVKLKEKLSGKKFFIVLDDIWNESYENWTKLCLPFEGGSRGSKIVVTTRNHSVSLKVGAFVAYPLKELSTNDCLSVFTRHSLGKNDFSEHEFLEEIGKKIIGKCGGLPLAAKTIGGLLRGKVNYKDWEDVLDSNMWNLPQEESGIVPAVTVSYYYLPSHLKRFLISFLQTINSKKQTKDLGNECFEELHSRSFFQQSSSNPWRFVMMHDLVNDLAQWAAKDFFFRIENLQEGEKQGKIQKTVRTFLTFSPKYLTDDSSCDFPSILLQLRRLRVLSLNGYPISELPDTIGDLKLLHYLDLSWTRIEFLPDSVNRLHNLEALILKGCSRLKRLCSDMGNLIKLRHFYISGSNSLRTLELFVVGKDVGSGLAELKELTHLQEKLHISGLENVNDLRDAEKADLNGKGGLKDLQLEWTCSNDGSNEKKEIATQVLEKLRPCQKLERLHIRGYGGTRFPQWLGDTSFSSLTSLTFGFCTTCASLPSIGQLHSLKKLFIHYMDGIESWGPEFYGHGYSKAPFQSLEEFEIWSLQEWRDWIPCGSGRDVEAFPRLRQLSIFECSTLQGKLPEHLPSLESLSIRHCEQLSVSVPIVPKHCSIEIDNCKEVVLSSVKDKSLLSSMVHLLYGTSSLIFLAEGFTKGFSKAEKLELVKYYERGHSLAMEYNKKSVESGYFDYFAIKMEEEELQQEELPFRVQYLCLEDFKFPVKLEEALQSLSFLRGLSIRNSQEIISFREAALPSQLRFITIHECNALQSLPMAWMHISNTSLKYLSIGYCDSLTCIARVQLPPNLKWLEIMHCSNLLTVLDEEEVSSSCRNTSYLEYLKIESCPSLTSLWSKSNELPDTLQKIKLSRCSNLAILASTGNLPKALRYLSIEECSKLEPIAKSFHDNTKLEKLYIDDCETLKTLPSGINNLISLKKLVMSNCPAMVSVPDGGFPTSLTCLVIADMKICKSLFEWGLHRLTSLEILEETGMILPTSLTALGIRNFPNLERLSSIAQNLTCLEKLYLCNCPKLKYFPEDGLPNSLKQLEIKDCPLLEERCEEGKGLYWSMISHISNRLSDYTSSEEDD